MRHPTPIHGHLPAFALLLGALLAPPVLAGTVSHTGLFTQDDDHFTLDFDLTGPGQVSMQTLSYGGGTNAAGAAIAAGGFVPTLSLFDDLLGLVALAHGGNACGDPGSGQADPQTHFCWDAGFSQSLGAGHYTLVLTQDGNEPGSTAADPFSQDGQHDYTAQLTGSPPGSTFIDLATGLPRSGQWALDLTVTPRDTGLPEPASLALALAGVLLMAGLGRSPGSAAGRR